ncbi:MAG: ABC transporter permease [Promethearchaeota archaeon]
MNEKTGVKPAFWKKLQYKMQNNKSWLIAQISLKNKLRAWEAIFFSIGFPIMFTVIFFLIYPDTFDLSIAGMIIYTTSFGTQGAAIVFAEQKSTGVLERLDTMPTGRKNIFLGVLISESIFICLQIIIMFILGYGILGLDFAGFFELFIGFLVAFLFGVQCIGLGIIFAAFSKNSSIANGISMTYTMPIIFASGAFVPFESSIVYFTPPFWAKQIFLQVTYFGHRLTDNLYSSSLIGYTATLTNFPIWFGLLILVAFTALFIMLGIIIFQKKTRF